MSEPTCSVPECGRSIKSRGLCNTHYQRLKTTGDVQADKPIRPWRQPFAPDATCAVDGCDRRPRGRGWCLKHYQKWQRNGTPDDWKDPGCSIEGCERSHYGGPGKWCRLHYRRWKTHGDPLTRLLPPQSMPQPKKQCSRPRCRRDAAARGMCRRHWGIKYRRENPEIMVAIAQRRRARLANAPVNDLTAQQWRDIKAAYQYRCAYCHKKRRLTADHVHPLSRGGAHTATNIVPACRSCNSRKNARPAPEYQPLLF